MATQCFKRGSEAVRSSLALSRSNHSEHVRDRLSLLIASLRKIMRTEYLNPARSAARQHLLTIFHGSVQSANSTLTSGVLASPS